MKKNLRNFRKYVFGYFVGSFGLEEITLDLYERRYASLTPSSLSALTDAYYLSLEFQRFQRHARPSVKCLKLQVPLESSYYREQHYG